MSEITAKVGELVQLSLTLYNGASGMYPRAYVYSQGIAIPMQVDLAHVTQGVYRGLHTAGGAGRYTVLYVVFSNSLRTNEATNYARSEDTLHVLPTDLEGVRQQVSRLARTR